MGIWAILGILFTTFLSVWATLKYVLLQKIRLDDNFGKGIIDMIRDTKLKFELSNDFSVSGKYPMIFQCFAIVKGNVFVFFDRNERMLQAGWQGKENLSEVYFLRWQKKKFQVLINSLITNEDSTMVLMAQPFGSDKLGQINILNPEIALEEYQYLDIEKDIEDMLNNGKAKTGCLLYSKPGMGKTRLVKYFSQKFKLPIYAINLCPDYNNVDILRMFANIPRRCIVLFEDFDNYFDKRKCIIPSDNIKFTYDVILNVLDGVYNDYKEVVFIMTVNDINKVDAAIKDRSSRFKFIREIQGPSFQQRNVILESLELAKSTEGMSLDKVFFIKDLKEKYNNEEIKKYIKTDLHVAQLN